MANASSKKIAASNKRTLANLQKGFLIINALYIAWRIIFYWSSFTLTQATLYGTTAGLTFMLYRILSANGTPTYSKDGNLVNSGDDLNSEGLTAYMFDIIYVTWFVHMTTAFISSKFWFVYLVIPAYAAYKIIPMVTSFLQKNKQGTNQDSSSNEGTSKRQMKLEKRANKRGGQVKYTR